MRLFITGSDTDVGKTWVTIQLIQRLQAEHQHALAIKPVVSGYQVDDQYGDVQRLLRAQSLHDVNAINHYRFSEPAAPSIAAASEKKHISMPSLLDWCNHALMAIDYGIIEGVGGLMVPLNDDVLVLDWMQALSLTHILLCVEWKLGCINQALLSIEALQQRGMTPDWLLLNARMPIKDQRHADAMSEEIRRRLPKKTCLLHATKDDCVALDVLGNSQ